MSEYMIRVPKKADAPQIIDYVNLVAEETDNLTFGQGEFSVTVEAEEHLIEQSNNDPNRLFLIACEQDSVIAMMTFQARTRERLKHYGEFGLSVQKQYWGKGIAKSMLTQLIEWAKDNQQIRKINLEVRADNDRAIQLYKRVGFREEGCISRYFLIDDKFYDAIIMGLAID
ncbi:GNAT family N-acetyltransferase [Paraliobacillus ryukyuensis]|uniref:GNAT family N-acetyltransferase n=1 Tax=Paraliobacillus ryukyuensis TaxID=200904 RepID=UPI0015C47C31|nr:GNAT family protein [Paraliobacillus ryukyuensis]